MKCPNCNKEIKDNAKFCRHCGSKIETHIEETKYPNNYKPSSSKTHSSYKSINKNKETSHNNTYKIAFLAILCIIVIAGVILLSGESHLNEHQITVKGINFNIPPHYTEVEWEYADNLKHFHLEDEWYLNQRGYEDESGQNIICFNVIDVKGQKVNDKYIKDILDEYSLSYKKKTINGHNGFLVQKTDDTIFLIPGLEPVYIFAYNQNDDIVLIGATNKSIFNQVIVE